MSRTKAPAWLTIDTLATAGGQEDIDATFVFTE